MDHYSTVILIRVLLKYLYFCLSSTDFKSKFELERKDTDCYNSSNTSGSQQQQQQHPSPLLPLPTPPHPFSSSSSAGVSGPGGVPVVTPAHLPDSTTDSWSGYYGTQRQDVVGKPFNNKTVSLKQRCRDYDGRNKVNHLFLLALYLCLLTILLGFFLFCLFCHNIPSSISEHIDV